MEKSHTNLSANSSLHFLQPEFEQRFSRLPAENTSTQQNFRRLTHCCNLWKFISFFTSLFPFVHTIRRYRLRDYALGDAVAGATVGIMQIPQVATTFLFHFIMSLLICCSESINIVSNRGKVKQTHRQMFTGTCNVFDVWFVMLFS